MSNDKHLRIRNSTAEFLIFTKQSGEETIEVRVADETVWLTQKMIGELFDKGRSTIAEHLQNIFKVTNAIAKSFAESEFEKYRITQDRLFESDFDRLLKIATKK